MLAKLLLKTQNAKPRPALLHQHSDRFRLHHVLRSDDLNFATGCTNILRGREARVYDAKPGFYESIENRESERLGVSIDHDVEIDIILRLAAEVVSQTPGVIGQIG